MWRRAAGFDLVLLDSTEIQLQQVVNITPTLNGALYFFDDHSEHRSFM